MFTNRLTSVNHNINNIENKSESDLKQYPWLKERLIEYKENIIDGFISNDNTNIKTYQSRFYIALYSTTYYLMVESTNEYEAYKMFCSQIKDTLLLYKIDS